MSRFKRLTDAEARPLTRGELLDRIEAEQAYWVRKRKTMTAEDDAAFREFTRNIHAYLDPAAAILDAIDHVEDRGSGSYWKTRPGEEATGLPAMDENQQAGLDYARRVFGMGGH